MTFFLAAITHGHWTEDPKFEISHCKSRSVYVGKICHNIHQTPILSCVKRMCISYTFNFFPDFVFGTIINQSQNRLAKLESHSVRLFMALWLWSCMILTVG